MAHRSQKVSPRPSRSSSPHNQSLAAMVPVPDDTNPASPKRQPQIDLPRVPSASKGGCWTCRLRRKKCDEQREGDSCKTCIRLRIKCLGWGPRRPEWMRDKQEVERYKAEIKAQLTRAGLIRGQPRTPHIYQNTTTPMMQTPGASRSHPYHRLPTLDVATSSSSPYPDYYPYAHEQHPHIRPGPAEHNVSGIHEFQLQIDPLFTEASLTLDPFYPQSGTPISSSSSTVDFPSSVPSQETHGYGFDLSPLIPATAASVPTITGQNAVQSDHVIYYFEHVRKIQFMFAGNSFTNATYSMILHDPRGAVSNAVCALANLHYTQTRVAQGLEAPNPNPELTNAVYFYKEAFFQLNAAKQMRNRYTEDEAMAALHLVCYSQLAGELGEWQPAFCIMCDWLAQTGLLSQEDPAIHLHTMSPTSQLLVKLTLWLDIFASISSVRPPRYLELLKRLLGERGGYWAAVGDTDGFHSLRMDRVTGCPDEAMLALAEVSNLAAWKANEECNGTLSFRELVREGDDIERRLRQHHTVAGRLSDIDQAPLDPRLQTQAMDPHVAPFPSEEARQIVSTLFCEAAVLSLHTILSKANPGVAEIQESVETIVRLLDKLTPSDIDRALVFPICLAGSLTDDASRRDFCKGRLERLDNGTGNLKQTRVVMEAIWQQRDLCGVAVDFRETVRERDPNLLLI